MARELVESILSPKYFYKCKKGDLLNRPPPKKWGEHVSGQIRGGGGRTEIKMTIITHPQWWQKKQLYWTVRLLISRWDCHPLLWGKKYNLKTSWANPIKCFFRCILRKYMRKFNRLRRFCVNFDAVKTDRIKSCANLPNEFNECK